jgi:hypothetical protein
VPSDLPPHRVGSSGVDSETAMSGLEESSRMAWSSWLLMMRRTGIVLLIVSVTFLLAVWWIDDPWADFIARNAYLLVVLVFFGVQLTFPWKVHTDIVAVAEQRLKEAMNQLKELIKGRLRYDDRRFLSARSVRSLAAGIQKQIGIHIVNDTLIAETVRLLAVELEDEYYAQAEGSGNGDELRAMLESLNRLLDELEPGSGTLLSIVEHDPLSAYKMSRPLFWISWMLLVPAVIVAVLVCLYPSWYWAVACWLFFGLYGIFFLSIVRARNYWSKPTNDATSRGGALMSIFSPNQLHPVIDCVSYVLVGYSSFSSWVWSIGWAPLWENPYLLSGSITDSMGMHTYRYFEALPVRRRLDALHSQLLKSQAAGETLALTDLYQYATLCRQLWIITGGVDYRLMEKKAREGLLLNIQLDSRNVDMTVHSEEDRRHLASLSRQSDPATVALQKRFECLHRYFLLHELGERQMTVAEMEEYIAVCQQLAQVTGSPQYRRFESKATFTMKRLS